MVAVLRLFEGGGILESPALVKPEAEVGGEVGDVTCQSAVRR